MTDYSEFQPLALGAGWIVEKNEFLKTDNKKELLSYRNHISENPLLVLKYEHYERKRKFSFQNYELYISVWCLKEYPKKYFKEYFKSDNCTDEYLIFIFVKPCNTEAYLLDKATCRDSQSTAETIKYLAGRYSSPYNWKKYQIAIIHKIWEKERIARNIKSMIVYHGTDEYYKSIDFIPVRISAGWNILLNSFCEKDIFAFPVRQQCNINDFEWERDISVYRLELKKSFVYVELQEYINECSTNSLLHIYVYYDLKDKGVFFEKLESIFCYSVEEAKRELEKMLWKYEYKRNFTISIMSEKGV